MRKLQQATVIFSLLLLSIPAFADSSIQCPPNGSSRQAALDAGWSELYGPYTVNDPLQYIKGPDIMGGVAYCTYSGTAIGGLGQLFKVVSTPAPGSPQ